MNRTTTTKNALSQIIKKEAELGALESVSISSTLEMIEFLKAVLKQIKKQVLLYGFTSQEQEIDFFKNIKPLILGKLIFYNKLYGFKCESPSDIVSAKIYFQEKLKQLHSEYKKYHLYSDIYKYYKTKASHRDIEYFTTGHINKTHLVNSFSFEINPKFSTFYDYKIARIITYELLSAYLNNKTTSYNSLIGTATQNAITWSESNSALIELIYALYVTKSVNHGKVKIKKLSKALGQVFQINISDNIHHTFHRMKTRSYSRTMFLDKLKQSLEDYMDQDQPYKG
ncbi:RteC domain-containing protein [Myroides odoratimimus]|uniref:RteC domain-containing protein n=1 Tax=Myroides odoratimimus TaxID=76832 RepID=UPI00257507AF|nr:RteC domain-containing protein [Myroides odoratimimus]MDM1402378.1 RteC domain-containing protein [Myroides odoratimimus]